MQKDLINKPGSTECWKEQRSSSLPLNEMRILLDGLGTQESIFPCRFWIGIALDHLDIHQIRYRNNIALGLQLDLPNIATYKNGPSLGTI